MTQLDAITVLGRLLRDGSLRDAFSRDPSSFVRGLSLESEVRRLVENLDPQDLERQARVLLRKRFLRVSRALPQTIERLAGQAWPTFHRYARSAWPEDPGSDVKDSVAFCDWLGRELPGTLSSVDHNRLRATQGFRRLAISFASDLPVGRGRRHGWQIFYRSPSRGLLEWWVVLPV